MIRPGIKRLFHLGLGRGATVDRDLDDEIELHLELRARRLEAAGMTPSEARLEARRRFGTLPAARRALRSTAVHRESTMRSREWFDGWRQDLRQAVRGLRHEPLFTGFVVATLALGIGANAAMFGVVDRLLLRGPDHVRDAKRVVRLYMTQRVPGYGDYTSPGMGYVSYLHLKDAGHDFDGVAAATVNVGMMGRRLEAHPIHEGSATSDFFSMLGVTAYRGRFFSAAEDRPADAQHVAVLGYGTWQRDFGGRDDAIGRDVIVGDERYTVIGVAPRGFTGTQLGPVDVWTPMSLIHPTRDWPHAWNAQWLQVYARLAPGVTLDEASADATAAHRATYVGTDSSLATARMFVAPIGADARGKASADTTVAQWMLGVSLIVLLIACANVTNLQLAREVRRRRELAVRIALGAGRGRMMRWLLTEGLLLGVAGAVAGIAVAYGMGGLIRAFFLPNVEWASSPVDGSVLGAALAIGVATGLAVGLVPAWRANRADLTGDLKAGAREGGGRRSRLRGALTVAQAALSTVLLVGAGLFVRSVQRVRAVDLGIQPDRVLEAELAIPGPYQKPDSVSVVRELERQRVLYRDVIARLRAMPGVAQASVTIGLPFETSFGIPLRVPGRDSIPRLAGGGPYVNAVTDGYFATVGTPLIEGRAFTADDRAGSEPVVIVNQTMANTLWPGVSALGQCLIVGDNRKETCTRVVGVVADTHRERIQELPAMQYYIPFGQEWGFGGTSILVRPSAGSPASLAEPVRRLLMSMVPSTPYVQTHVLEDDIVPQYRSFELGASMFSLCGVLALIVAAVGLYSVMSYLVAQRRHEFGVRIALGARGGDVMRLVLSSGVSVAVLGVALGLAAALAGARWIAPLLFETSARDPVVYAVVALSLVSVAIAASVGPGLRAERIDPLEALRAE